MSIGSIFQALPNGVFIVTILVFIVTILAYIIKLPLHQLGQVSSTSEALSGFEVHSCPS